MRGWRVFAFRATDGQEAASDGDRIRIGLALTFDEFGMWIHLGGSYWQRASFDAVAVLIGILGFIAYFPSSRSLRRQPWWQVAVVVAGAAVFFAMLYDSFRYAGKRLGPRMEIIEQSGPK